MVWPVTVIGAISGMALANIPGALLGALLGQVLDRRLGLHSWASLRARLSGVPLPREDELLFMLLGRLVKSEGRVLEAHIQQARAEMRELRLDEVAQRRVIDAFSRGKEGRDGLRGLLRQQRGRRGAAQALLRACWRMAWADGRVTEQERQLILQWGTWLGLDDATVHALGEEYTPRKGPPARSAGGAYQDALRLLGVRADSEPVAIKRAYRRLLSQHHPDKLAGAGAGPVQVREATEKTRELQSAYRLIRERHGFR